MPGTEYYQMQPNWTWQATTPDTDAWAISHNLPFSENQATNVQMTDGDNVSTWSFAGPKVTNIKMGNGNETVNINSSNVTLYEGSGSGVINLTLPAQLGSAGGPLNFITIYAGLGQYTINNPNNYQFHFIPLPQVDEISDGYYHMPSNWAWRSATPDEDYNAAVNNLREGENVASNVQMTEGDYVYTWSYPGPDLQNIKMTTGVETVNVTSSNVTIYEGSGNGTINLINDNANYAGTPLKDITIYGGTGNYTINNASNNPFHFIPLPQAETPHKFLIGNQTTHTNEFKSGEAFTGPVANITDECIMITPDNLNINSQVANTYIKTGSGDDALNSLAGTNVLDGGGGSNFITPGSGFDTIFCDARAGIETWDTVNNAHIGSGDNITVWVNSLNNLGFHWQDNQGAVGAQGLTLFVSQPDKPPVEVTLAGFNSSQLGNELTFTQGTVEGNNYLMVHIS